MEIETLVKEITEKMAKAEKWIAEVKQTLHMAGSGNSKPSKAETQRDSNAGAQKGGRRRTRPPFPS